MENFVPYYYEMKVAGHMACAWGASAVGGFLMYLASFWKGTSQNFFKCCGVSMLCASLLWLMPVAMPMKSHIGGLCAYAIGIGSLLVIKYSLKTQWDKSIAIWLAFLVSQTAIFLTIIYYSR